MDFSEPILSQNRYGREDILSLYRKGAAPQGVVDCRFFVEESLPPAILQPQSEAEMKAHSNMNSSKAVNNLHRDHQHNGGTGLSSIGINGAQSPFSPSWVQRGRTGFGRGGGTTGINMRAQALFDPKDPKDRPRNRLRSVGEEDPSAIVNGSGWVQVQPKASKVPIYGSTRATTEAPHPRNLHGSWRRQDSQIGATPPGTPGTDDVKSKPEWADDTYVPEASTGAHGSFDDDGNFRPAHSEIAEKSRGAVHTGSPPSQMDEGGFTGISSAFGSSYGFSSTSSKLVQQTTPNVGFQRPGAAYESTTSWEQKTEFSVPTSSTDQHIAEAIRQLKEPSFLQQTKELSESKWYYLDPNNAAHGPFAKANMQGWFNSGYFSGDLKVRRDVDSTFTTLAELCRRYGDTTPFDVPKDPSPPVAAVAPSWGLGSSFGAPTAPQVAPSHQVQAELHFQRIEEENRRLAEETRRLLAIQQTIMSEKEQFQEKERAIRELEEQVKRQAEEFARMKNEQIERERRKEIELQAELERIRQLEIEKEKELKRKEDELLLKEQLAKQKQATEDANRRHEELLEQKRQQDEERRNWEAQKNQFETRKSKEAKQKEKADEEAKKKKEEELKKQKEEELERQRRLEQMRPRDSKVSLNENITCSVPASVERCMSLDAKSVNKVAPWIKKSIEGEPMDMRNLREIQMEEERKNREFEKFERERMEALRKAQAAETHPLWSNSTQRLNWSGSGPAWGGAGMAPSHPVPGSLFDGPVLSQTSTKTKSVAVEQAKPKVMQAKTPKKAEGGKKSAPKDDPLTKWVVQRVRKLNADVDGEMFADFIRNVVTPQEVEDYMVTYFGESNATKEFCKEFLQRRSELRAKSKAADRDDLSRPAHAQGPSSASTPVAPPPAAGGKKKKKGKGVKMIVDGASLGFRAAGDPNRINAGEIDVVGNEW
ncbi:hypothetical protein QR680_008931 [Steinernema hermaphroditum]|uniref:GYF domain-containing protein n=1 Tax=Steinernema hermaphroditum TaxID=289476 RepID=A0AA39IIF9_9BILA|nr:hypothetical protein QR680_008931 [Steinernema hermaphroditum]